MNLSEIWSYLKIILLLNSFSGINMTVHFKTALPKQYLKLDFWIILQRYKNSNSRTTELPLKWSLFALSSTKNYAALKNRNKMQTCVKLEQLNYDTKKIKFKLRSFWKLEWYQHNHCLFNYRFTLLTFMYLFLNFWYCGQQVLLLVS